MAVNQEAARSEARFEATHPSGSFVDAEAVCSDSEGQEADEVPSSQYIGFTHVVSSSAFGDLLGTNK